MIKNILNYLSASILVFIFGVLLLPIYTRFLTPYDYGVLALYVLFGQITVNIISFSLDSANYRFYFEEKYNQNNFKKLNSTNLIALVFFNIVGFILVYLFIDIIENFILNKKISKEIILISYLFALVSKIYQYFNKLLEAQEKSKIFSQILITNFVICNSISLLLIYYYSAGFYGKIIGDFIGFSLSTILLLYLFRKEIYIYFSINLFQKSYKYSLPLVPNQIAGILNDNTSKYLITYFRNLNEFGVYEIAHRLSNLNRLFIDNITRSWSPFFLNHVQKDKIIIKNYYSKIISFISIYYLFFIFFSEEVIIILTTPSFYFASSIMPIIITQMFIMNSCSLIYIPQITFSKKTKYILYINIIGLIFNLMLGLFFIPIYGIIGAAISILLSSIIISFVGLQIGKRLCDLKLKFLNNFLLIIFILLLMCIQLFLLNLDLNFILKIILKVLLIIFYLSFLFLFKFLILDDIKIVLKQINKSFFNKIFRSNF